MRSPRWFLATVVACTAIAGAAPSTALAASPHQARSSVSVTGNAATIAFYRKVVRATRAAPAVDYEFGDVDSPAQAKFEPGGHVNWYWDVPPQPGYKPVPGIVWVGARGGRVQFVTATLVCGRSDIRRACFPFGLVLTPRGEIILSGGASTVPASTPIRERGYQPCYGPTVGRPQVGSYSKLGVASGYGLYGHFLPIRRSGDTVLVTSTYPYGSRGQRATEVDTISATTFLPSRYVIHVSAAAGVAGFVVGATVHWFKVPYAPPNSNGICATYLKSIS